MSPTTGARPHASPPPRPRWRAVLVLAVLVGLLGMHALAPGGDMGHPGHVRAAHATVAVTAPHDCPDDDGHRGGHRAHHADPACASGAVDDGPRPAPPAPGPAHAAPPAARPRPGPATAPEGARAPPDLAELQLLRI